MNYPLSSAFMVFHSIFHNLLSFFLNSSKSLVFFYPSPMCDSLFCCSISVYLLDFRECCCCRVVLINRGDQIGHNVLLKYFWFFVCVLCYTVCVNFYGRFHEMLRRRYILSCLWGRFHRCLLRPFLLLRHFADVSMF